MSITNDSGIAGVIGRTGLSKLAIHVAVNVCIGLLQKLAISGSK
jgi:hypothetical protein